MEALPEFMIPRGFEAPTDVQPGAEFNAVAVLRQKPDGKLCLVSLDGAKFEGEEEEYEEEGEDDEVALEDGMSEEGTVTTQDGNGISGMKDMGFAERIRRMPVQV